MLSRSLRTAMTPLAAASRTAVRRTFATTRPARISEEEDKFFDELAEDISTPQTKSELDALRRQLRKIDAMASEAAKPLKDIDFADYRTKIRAPGLVDNIEKAYKKAEAELATMDMDVSKEIADSEAKFAAIIKRAEEMKVSSTAAKVELEKELAACRAEKAAFADLTIEEELKKNPEIAAEIEKEINKDEWFVL
uniref:ATP synthase subunit d, mitochondrial n=2 Tax=Hemiselmis andersenii TaxID=464988 RepID=A0A7S1MW09_HEMAN|mmetsp:Transcript_59751/g.143950  ORF Transcript_59751/g.143950 Transcript_59751/m.143950 type:complete len:195 (+) Transcript_59751:39-623(+)